MNIANIKSARIIITKHPPCAPDRIPKEPPSMIKMKQTVDKLEFIASKVIFAAQVTTTRSHYAKTQEVVANL
jgi:hypothetical protein